MATARINEVQLYYEVHGTGVPLLLVAGLASDSQSWQPILGALARQHCVITLDNRGVGRTRPSEHSFSIEQLADDCMGLISYLGLASVHLLGHSMGGFVAQACALRYPAAVASLLLAGTALCNSQRNTALFGDWAAYLEAGMDRQLWFSNFFYWIFSRRFFEHEATVQEALRLAIDYPYPQSTAAFRKQVQALAGFNSLEALPTITAKTMVMCGKEDLLFPPEESAQLAQAIPGARLALIEQAAHALHVEKPQAFTECVLQFLAQG
jgi:pimeloyl-ACP methyl ester carboxylesterase